MPRVPFREKPTYLRRHRSLAAVSGEAMRSESPSARRLARPVRACLLSVQRRVGADDLMTAERLRAVDIQGRDRDASLLTYAL